jgi:hypothetical protein
MPEERHRLLQPQPQRDVPLAAREVPRFYPHAVMRVKRPRRANPGYCTKQGIHHSGIAPPACLGSHSHGCPSRSYSGPSLDSESRATVSRRGTTAQCRRPRSSRRRNKSLVVFVHPQLLPEFPRRADDRGSYQLSRQTTAVGPQPDRFAPGADARGGMALARSTSQSTSQQQNCHRLKQRQQDGDGQPPKRAGASPNVPGAEKDCRLFRSPRSRSCTSW